MTFGQMTSIVLRIEAEQPVVFQLGTSGGCQKIIKDSLWLAPCRNAGCFFIHRLFIQSLSAKVENANHLVYSKLRLIRYIGL